MSYPVNHLGQILGKALPDWQNAQAPSAKTITGRFCRLEPLDVERHAAGLWAALALDSEGRHWTYLPYGPFTDEAVFRAWLGNSMTGKADPFSFAIIDVQSNLCIGFASLMRIEADHGCIEIGHVNFSPLLQRTPMATEAIYLLMNELFALGYRRCEWKCNSHHSGSRAAAQRLGFSYEGIFRNARVFKGHNRDTAWYATISEEWPTLKAAFETWLSPDNFATNGQQRISLRSLTEPLLITRA